MYVRLAFAVAAHLQSEILLIDEVLAVGDAEFQRKCLGKMKDVARGGRSVVFVSHHIQSVQVLCNRGMYLENGAVKHFGGITETIDRYVASYERPLEVASEPNRRPGSGEFRFTEVRPTKETFTCGEEKKIAFTISRVRPSRGNVFVSAHIVNDGGIVIAQCDSRLVGVWFGATGGISGRFGFRTPWLKAGQYRVEMFICSAGVVDRFDDACRINVIPLLPYPTAGNDEATCLGLIHSDFTFEQT
jgi:lipopolysaccharide transport system ATP-binding protein